MHLLVPFASPLSEASPGPASAALTDLQAPVLQTLLSRLPPAEPWHSGDEWSLSPPHEQALSRLSGWSAGASADGLVPMAAWLALSRGLPGAERPGWAIVTPTHWNLGTEQVSLFDPAQLGLDEGTAQRLYADVGELFTSEGYDWHWLSASQWMCRHDELAELPTASLDRVIGRNIDRWLTPDRRARRLRRLQNEAQMLLHSHPLNAQREERGAWTVNSLWCSGTGCLPQGWRMPQALQVQISDALRAPSLAQDSAAWREAFLRWDEQVLAPWVALHADNPQASLTLCGERSALHWQMEPVSAARSRQSAARRGGLGHWLAALAQRLAARREPEIPLATRLEGL